MPIFCQYIIYRLQYKVVTGCLSFLLSQEQRRPLKMFDEKKKKEKKKERKCLMNTINSELTRLNQPVNKKDE